MILYKRAETDRELQQILELQQLNLLQHLDASEKLKEGFLTVEHSFELLKAMNLECPHTLALDSGEVVGYALSMHPRFCEEIEVLRPMFNEINQVIKDGEKYMVMGQVCVAKAYRGQGIFRMLYAKMKKFIQPDFTKIITEVDTKNIRSIQAHEAIGFDELKRYTSHGKEWSLIVWET